MFDRRARRPWLGILFALILGAPCAEPTLAAEQAPVTVFAAASLKNAFR